ncbi:MAG: phage virion morphogenesis protein [Candidatus Kapabacteria bacterium]|nr:phage virion morphogenesis protein [Ignavibacteriota bacterium]MCW5886386.1 phage virion morphogenesis protein [Candidatus Kapabacteria bacterium]
MNITLKLDDIQFDIERYLNSVNMSPFYNAAGKILTQAVRDNFDTQGAYFNRGTAWMPLAPSTVEQRDKLGLSRDDLLKRRGGDAGLFGSINFTANSTGVEVGTNLFYAKYLHFGTKFMPPRPIFPENELPPDVIEDLTDAMARFLKRNFN